MSTVRYHLVGTSEEGPHKCGVPKWQWVLLAVILIIMYTILTAKVVQPTEPVSCLTHLFPLFQYLLSERLRLSA